MSGSQLKFLKALIEHEKGITNQNIITWAWSLCPYEIVQQLKDRYSLAININSVPAYGGNDDNEQDIFILNTKVTLRCDSELV